MSNNKRASRDERSMREKMRLRRAAGGIKALQQQIGAREKRAWDLQSGVIGRTPPRSKG